MRTLSTIFIFRRLTLNAIVKHMLLTCVIMFSFTCFSQTYHNLVYNSSFEKYDSCPDSYGQISRSIGWKNICSPWCEYFNTCANGNGFGVPSNDWGNQSSYFGNAYSQIAAHITVVIFREYMGCILIEPLKVNHQYVAEFHLSLAEISSVACDQIGLLLTQDEIICPDTNFFTLSAYHPQIVSPKNFIINDTLNWITINGTFIAGGGEKYLTLGIFPINDSIHWVFRSPWWTFGCEYYIDDVYVYDVDFSVSAQAGNDTIICFGDSLRLGLYDFADYQYQWTNAEGLSDTLGRPWVKPEHTTTYILKQINFKHEVSYDTIVVTVEECFEPLTIPNVFTPNGDGKNDRLEIVNPGNYAYTLNIYNRWGQLVYSGDETQSWDGKIQGSEISDGVYFYSLTGKHPVYNIKYSGVVHLIR